MKYEQIIRDLKNKVYHPIYLLWGDEEFFIDQITDYIENNILDEAEKEFNQTVVYGMDVDTASLVAQAKRFPMMANYNVVIVKEAQNLKDLELLDKYAAQPLDTTILVLAYKHKKPDGRSAFVKRMKKQGVVFESEALREHQVPAWIEKYLKSKGFQINPLAVRMLVENLGVELSKITNELDKLCITLGQPKEIDENDIERNIGISKDFNVFELNKAIGNRDLLRANKIVTYFARNGKDNPPAKVIPMLYSFFSKTLLFHSLKSRDQRTVGATLGINPYFAKDYEVAARNYPVKKIARVISALREADLQSKGVGGGSLSDEDIYKELIFKILH